MATNTTNNTFDIPKGGYVAFDAMSLRDLILNRLNEQKIFTDQNFLGSNLASIIDIIAYSYHTLIYYLNKTSSESMFSEAQLYENINRIVKLIDYSPVGFQTSTLTFNCSAQVLTPGLYTIPRYSYVLTNDIPFSFNEDITFIKTSTGIESLNELAQQKLLFQGFYEENPIYTAAGDENEIVILDTAGQDVDHFNIDVYVKNKLTGVWQQFTKTSNLFLEDGSAKKCEIRINSNKRYEIKFGNGVNGVKLESGDEVAIYYLVSNGSNGVIGANALGANTRLIRYDTTQYNTILNDIFSDNVTFLSNLESGNLIFGNDNSSTTPKEAETVEEIRQTAPSVYKSQYRLVTTRDFDVFIKSNFSNLISDVRCVNNWAYTSQYLKYFYDLGIQDPSKTQRALFNQVNYADSCNFNNIYMFITPRSATQNLDYLSPAQKELISSSLQPIKLATIEPVFIDPVYKAVSLGVTSSQETLDPITEEEFCRLEVIKRSSSRRNNESIALDIVNIIKNYFNRTQTQFGALIDTRFLTQQILSIDGVERIYTTRTDNPSLKAEGVSLFLWNPIYPENDKQSSINNIPLRFFEYPFFNNLNNLYSKINVITVNNNFEITEY
jgi:hypothetical protein